MIDPKKIEIVECKNFARNARNFIRNVIQSGIEDLSKVSYSIDYFMNDPKIKNAAVPDVRYHHAVDSELKSNPYISWENFRNERHAKINPSSKAFELAYFDLDDLSQKGFFKIIQDDCNDMMVVLSSTIMKYNFCRDDLKNAETLTSSIVESVISSIPVIVGRFHYMIGYHGLKYLYEQATRERGRKGGKQPKLLRGILWAVKELLQNNKRENYSAERLWKYFEDKHKGKKNAFKVNGFKIYFDYTNRNSDEERIFQLSNDRTIKSRSRSAFNGYVKEAKKSLK